MRKIYMALQKNRPHFDEFPILLFDSFVLGFSVDPFVALKERRVRRSERS